MDPVWVKVDKTLVLTVLPGTILFELLKDCVVFTVFP